MPTVPRTAYFLATLLALASCVLAACPSTPIVSRADNAQLAYTYDPQGNRLTLTDAAGEVTQYTYDAANRLTGVSAPGVGATSYAYDRASQLRGRAGQGGLVTDYGYDDAGRIASITHRIGSTPTLRIGYTHNANGNRIQQVIEHAGSAAETADFEYDAADRLVRSHDGQSDTRWTLDAAGNRTLEEVREGGVLTRRTAYTVDVRDRLRTATPELPTGPPTEYAYDADGNLLSETTGSAVTTYRWDARDRLIEQTLPGQSAIQNRYDDADRRIARSDGASGSRYRWDGNALLEETNAVGNRLTRYHRGAGLIGASSASESRLYLTDSQNTPLALLRPDGAISGRAQYDIWGKTRSESGEQSKLGFTGYQKERGDLYQAVARYYRPGSASFLSIDPWEGDYKNPASLNKYLYGYGNPGIFVDPDGRVGLLRDGAQTLGDFHHWLGERSKLYDRSVGGYLGASATGVAQAFFGGAQGFLGGVNYASNWVALAGATVVGSETAQEEIAGEIYGTHQTADYLLNQGGVADAYEAARETTVLTYEGDPQALGKTVEVVAGFAMGGRIANQSVSTMAENVGSTLRGASRWAERRFGIDTPDLREIDAQMWGDAAPNHRAELVIKEGDQGNLVAECCARCFGAGTLVMTADGLRPIESVNVGQRVVARDEVSGETSFRIVEHIIVRTDRVLFDLTFADGDKLEVIAVTADHRFHTADRGWVVSAELKVGEAIESLDGRRLVFVSRSTESRIAPTYNLSVAEDHNYFVGESGLWVHNCTPCGAAGSSREIEVDGFRLAKHGDMPSPRPEGKESHHGVMSRWMAENYGDYNKDYAPAVLMPSSAHDATRGLYNTWRAEARRQQGGVFSWGSVSESEIRELSNAMFEAAKVPAPIRDGYWQWFERMKLALEKPKFEQ